MKEYLIRSAIITYLRLPTDEELASEPKTVAILMREAIANYRFIHSDILPDEYITTTNVDGEVLKLPEEGYCYTVFDMTKPKGWFWIAKEAVKEIE